MLITSQHSGLAGRGRVRPDMPVEPEPTADLDEARLEPLLEGRIAEQLLRVVLLPAERDAIGLYRTSSSAISSEA